MIFDTKEDKNLILEGLYHIRPGHDGIFEDMVEDIKKIQRHLEELKKIEDLIEKVNNS